MKFAKKGRRRAVGSPGRMTRGSECGSPSSAQPPSTCSRRPSLAILTGDLASPECFSTIAIYGRHVLVRARAVKRQQTSDDQEGGYIPLRGWQHSFAHDAMHEARGLTKTCGLLEIDWRTSCAFEPQLETKTLLTSHCQIRFLQAATNFQHTAPGFPTTSTTLYHSYTVTFRVRPLAISHKSDW